MDINKIDFLLQNAADEERLNAPAESWQVIADALHKKKKRRFFWILFPAILLVGLGAYFLIQNSNKATNQTASLKKSIDQNKTNTTVLNTTTTDENLNKESTVDNKVINTTNENEITTSKKNIISAKEKVFNSGIQTNVETVNNSTTYTTNSKDFNFKSNRNLSYSNDISTIKKNGNNKVIRTKKKSSLESFNKEQDVAKGSEIMEAYVEENKEENSMLKTNKQLKSTDSNVEKSMNSNNTVSKNILDTSAKALVKINTLQIATKNKKIVNSSKLINPTKWNKYYSVSFNSLNIVNKTLFNINSSSSKIADAGNYSVVNGFSGAALPNNQSSYNNGFYFSLENIWKKNRPTKKTSKQFGWQIGYGAFKTPAYNALSATITQNNGTLIIDSSAFGNSNYAATPTNSLGYNLSTLHNHFLQIGVITGVDFTLMRIKKQPKLHYQLQFNPTITLSQKINWYDLNTYRYFTDKKLNNHFTIHSMGSLLWEFKIKNTTFFAGPNLSSNWGLLNKNVSGLENVINTNFGFQLQMKINK